MARTYAEIKSLINSKLGKVAGTLTNADLLNNVNLALDALRSEVDFRESQRTAALAPALFKDVTWYTPPTDLFGTAIIDIRPLVEIPPSPRKNDWQQNTTVEFENNLLGDHAPRKWTIETNGATRYLRLLTSNPTGLQNILINNCDTYDGNGTFVADTTNSDANTVATSTTNYFEGIGAVKFNVTVGQSVNNRAVIYNNDLTSVDISDMDSPYLFFYVYLPSVTNFTSVTMYLGSDSSATPSTKANYYTFTATTQFDGSALVAGKNLIGILKDSATETGTVDDTVIQYVELRLNYTGSYTSQVDCLLDGIYLREGELQQVRYMSTNLVVPSGSSTTQQYFEADDDELILDSDGERLFIDFATGYIAQNVRDTQSAAIFIQIAQKALSDYKSRYPQERKLTMRNYYYS